MTCHVNAKFRQTIQCPTTEIMNHPSGFIGWRKQKRPRIRKSSRRSPPLFLSDYLVPFQPNKRGNSVPTRPGVSRCDDHNLHPLLFFFFFFVTASLFSFTEFSGHFPPSPPPRLEDCLRGQPAAVVPLARSRWRAHRHSEAANSPATHTWCYLRNRIALQSGLSLAHT